ncbi:unnamed protein product [Phaeothamnion confervicola]
MAEFSSSALSCEVSFLVTCKPFPYFPTLLHLVLKTLVFFSKVVLEAEEAVFSSQCPCCNIETRRPYGELGSVDSTNCCCCVGVGSGLTGGMAVFPGCGCDAALVNEIVAEMKKRQQERGDTAQLLRTEEQAEQMALLHAKMDAVMRQLGVPPVSSHKMSSDRYD